MHLSDRQLHMEWYVLGAGLREALAPASRQMTELSVRVEDMLIRTQTVDDNIITVKYTIVICI